MQTEESGEIGRRNESARGLWILAMVNVGIWAIAMVTLVFVVQKSPAARDLLPILAAGSAVGIAMIAATAKLRS